ncbi:TM2 domain-containing protein [Gramella sp. GC03-9]|uniref:TM2 domain-containing protein n=1 Tax=Christiangramia oceanisediminis TaxID=2920386 RepID=A0A9X2KW64_9FLAO|nr:TM2 domain-containing protein [Gramella oceanisediminis]MCP9199515.1 TM2 domain-containing protein [Gramella oceanisediminis]
MKLKFFLSILMFALALNSSYASFPVQRTLAASETVSVEVEEGDDLFSPAAVDGEKSQGVAMLLLLFAGIVAAHRWYLGSPWYWNVLYILTLGGLGIWALVDFIGIVTGSYKPRKGSYQEDFF